MDDVIPIRGGLPAAGRATSMPILDWHLAFIALTGLEFLQIQQTVAGWIFVGGAMVIAAREPGRALLAVYHGGIPWLYVALCFLSVLWSPVPDISIRGAIQVALSTGAAFVIARGLSPRRFLLAVMGALLVASLASLVDRRIQVNAGVPTLVGIFGSKNQLGLSQAILMITAAWVFLDRSGKRAQRWLALGGGALAFLLLIAARSLDATVVAIGALACSYCGYKLNWFPRGWRPLILCGVIFSVIGIFAFLLLFSDDLFGQGLQLLGKDSTLTGRTYLWERATQMMRDNPILGVGLQAFWVQGNPYAEELWARFQPGRTGYNFHNIWYEIGVHFGYVGLCIAALTVCATSASVIRWALRSPEPASCFFLAIVIFANARTFVESELFGQFSLLAFLYVAGFAYARQSRVSSRREAAAREMAGAPHRGAARL
jgi:exopolysaccharide production protein ExoQ